MLICDGQLFSLIEVNVGRTDVYAPNCLSQDGNTVQMNE